MRGSGALLCLLALAACSDRRDFDQRYNDTGAELEKRVIPFLQLSRAE